jgi:hypothetical protein
VASDEPDLGPKEFGPKALYTPHQIGNYEPKVVSQNGPGMGFYMCSVHYNRIKKCPHFASFIA